MAHKQRLGGHLGAISQMFSLYDYPSEDFDLFQAS